MKNEEFEKWADENLMYGGDRWAAFQGYQMRQPEIDALTEEVALCHGTLDSRTRNIETLMKENAALQAEVERLRGDAERYAYLRHRTGGYRDMFTNEAHFRFPVIRPIGDWLQGSAVQHLDVAIDALMKETK